MLTVVGLLDGAALQGLGIAAAVVGVCFAFRVLRYPDLTAEGSFLIGAAMFAGSLQAGYGWLPATLFATLSGGLAGCVTAVFNLFFGVHRLLAGILTTMCAYSLAFRGMGGRSNVGLHEIQTALSGSSVLDERFASTVWIHPYSVGLLVVVTCGCAAAVLLLLRSDLGLVLRALGSNTRLLERLGYSSNTLTFIGLAGANALISFSATLVASRQGFVDINMGSGLIVTLIASLVLGEQLIRSLDKERSGLLLQRIVAPIIGALAYALLYLGILRASLTGALPFQVHPTDLKMLSAIVLAIAVATQLRSRGSDEVLPI